MLCPRCSTPMKKNDSGEHGFVVVDECHQCGGAWFDKGDLDKLDEHVWVDVESHPYHSAEGDHPSAECPVCKSTLDPVSPTDAAQVIFDRCSSCQGFWLDQGELSQIQALADEMGSEMRANMKHLRKPTEWSWLRWIVHNYSEHYSR